MSEDPMAFQSFRDDHARVLGRLDCIEAELRDRWLGEPRPIVELPLLELVGLLEAQFATHMRDEEELLFPVLAESAPETAGVIAGLRDEHAELRQMLAAIDALLARPASASRDEQLTVQLRDFVDLLRLHVHKEEDAVFRVAGRVLNRQVVHALARQLDERRAADPRITHGR